MDGYQIKLAPSAVRVYEKLYSLTAAETGKEVPLVSANRVIEILRMNPLRFGMPLPNLPPGIFWVSRGGFHFFFEINLASRIVQILAILDGPVPEDRIEKAEVLATTVLLESMAEHGNLFARAMSN